MASFLVLYLRGLAELPMLPETPVWHRGVFCVLYLQLLGQLLGTDTSSGWFGALCTMCYGVIYYSLKLLYQLQKSGDRILADSSYKMADHTNQNYLSGLGNTAQTGEQTDCGYSKQDQLQVKNYFHCYPCQCINNYSFVIIIKGQRKNSSMIS